MLGRGAMPGSRMLLRRPWLRLRPGRSLDVGSKRMDAPEMRQERSASVVVVNERLDCGKRVVLWKGENRQKE